MSPLRIAGNLALAIALLYAAVYLLGQDSYYLRERWRHTGTATLFSGAALYCLAAGLMCLAAFALTVAYCWLTGKAAMPDPAHIRPHPTYKGTLLVRFWYLVLPAFALILLAYLLADQVPSRALQATPEPRLTGQDRNTQK